MLTPLQARAALALWRSRQFETADIARVLQFDAVDTAFLLDLLATQDRHVGRVIQFPRAVPKTEARPIDASFTVCGVKFPLPNRQQDPKA